MSGAGQPRRVAILVHAVFPGDPRVRRQSDALLEAGHEVDVICLRRPGEPVESVENGVRVRRIPIDRTFIGDLEHNHHSMAIVRAIIPLGHSMSVPILAEGVETEAQRKFLLQEGCDEMQGYLTGKPQPIESYAGMVGREPAPERAAAAG